MLHIYQFLLKFATLGVTDRPLGTLTHTNLGLRISRVSCILCDGAELTGLEPPIAARVHQVPDCGSAEADPELHLPSMPAVL
jgi:hypothetical protein